MLIQEAYQQNDIFTNGYRLKLMRVCCYTYKYSLYREIPRIGAD